MQTCWSVAMDNTGLIFIRSSNIWYLSVLWYVLLVILYAQYLPVNIVSCMIFIYWCTSYFIWHYILLCACILNKLVSGKFEITCQRETKVFRRVFLSSKLGSRISLDQGFSISTKLVLWLASHLFTCLGF